jgi:predicted nuclease of restriction endonuclease-like RecB superfamily
VKDGGVIVLTKDLLRYRKAGARILPSFVDAGNARLLEFASSLITTFEESLDLTRAEIEEICTPLLKSGKDSKTLLGIHRTLLGRCDFSHRLETDYSDLRSRLFRASAERLRTDGDGVHCDPSVHRATVLGKCGISEPEGLEQVFADLPEYERLERVRKTFPAELLQRYNVSLVQSLLLRSKRLHLRVCDPDSSAMRGFLRHLRFFRLLADIRKDSDGNTGNRKEGTVLDITVDGPLSLFENTQKYGLQIACFFPAVCRLATWRLAAVVEIDERQYDLKLDESCGLRPQYRSDHEYVPDEIRRFEEEFSRRDTVWQVVDGLDLLDFGNQEIVFPDFSFRSRSPACDAGIVHLELFHRWHSGPLSRRIAMLDRTDDTSGGPALLIGVDRALSKKAEIESMLANSEWFRKRGFLYRDFPGIEAVGKLLDAIEGETKKEKHIEQPVFEF